MMHVCIPNWLKSFIGTTCSAASGERIIPTSKSKTAKKDKKPTATPKKQIKSKTRKKKEEPSPKEKIKKPLKETKAKATKAKTTTKKKKKNTSGYYVNPVELTKELAKFAKTRSKRRPNGKCSEKLGEMFLAIARNLANRSNFINYTYKEDLISKGLMFLVLYANRFDIRKSSNGFSYCTQICFNGFRQVLDSEKKVSLLKDKIINKRLDELPMDEPNDPYGYATDDDDEDENILLGNR